MKRARLQRSQKPLARRTPMPTQREPLQRSGRLRFRSPKMEQVYQTVRRPLAQMLLATNPICVRCLTEPAVDPHEVLPRGRGGSITDPANVVPLGRVCHDWIGRNPAAAEAEGWLRRTNPPKCPTCAARLMKLTGADAGYLCQVCQLAWTDGEVSDGSAEFELSIPWKATP